jgi:cephalosporin hydroxylase
MKLTIDFEQNKLSKNDQGRITSVELYSKEGFELLSHYWLKVAWNEKYPYTFTWLGRPIIQLPHDMVRLQEAMYRVKPDVVIETGVAHGGSLIFHASVCKALGKGRVIGIDNDIRKHNRKDIESHELASWIQLIEGDSVSSETIERVKAEIRSHESVMVILDSCHTKQHVLKELEAYKNLVTPGSYLIATDGFMRELHDTPRGKASWRTDGPLDAIEEFLGLNSQFITAKTPWPFNESGLTRELTHWPGAWLIKKPDL